ncbi:MAG TPA: tRNA (guanosine(46)-N7)-methyltransferase TrmB [Pseudonocardia sp.]
MAEPHRQVASFVHHRARLTEGQQAAWERWWPVRGRDVTDLLDGAAAYDPAAWFGRSAPLVLEIGSGMGESTAALAAAEPDVDVVAVEVFEPGIAALLMRIADAELTNLQVLRGDAVALLRECVPESTLAGIRIFFPDPWPKRRHRKRRLVQPDFVALAAARLRPGGTLHMATDWDDYAAQMQAAADGEPRLENTAVGQPGGSTPRPGWRPVTKFEARARTEGRDVHDLVYRRCYSGEGSDHTR